MKQFTYKIRSSIGIHVIPAAQIVAVAERFDSHIMITKGQTTMNCKTLMGLIALGVKCGESVTITISGPDEDIAANTMLDHFESCL